MADDAAGGALQGAASGAAAGTAAFPGIGTVIGAGIGAIGGYLSQSSANAASKESAQQQMLFQAQMDSTKYQRTVADLKAAGLNPMLAYTNGVGSTPSGASYKAESAGPATINGAVQGAAVMAQVENTKAQTELAKANAIKAVTEAKVNEAQVPYIGQLNLSSAQSASESVARISKMDQEKLLMQSQIRRLGAQNRLTEVEVDQALAQIPNIIATGGLIRANTGNVKVDTLLRQLEVPGATNRMESDLTGWGRQIRPYLNDIGKVTNSAGDAARAGFYWRR